MAWTKTKIAIAVATGVLLTAGVAKLAIPQNEQGDNTYNAPSVRAFKEHLGSNTPVKLLRFSEIDGGTKVQRHYLAIVDGNDFFLREYKQGEDPFALITTNNCIQDGQLNGLYHGRLHDECWSINGLYLHKSAVTNTDPNGCQLGMNLAKATIDSVLNLGMSAFTFKPGSVVWNATDSAKLSVSFAKGVSVSLNTGTVLTNTPGFIIVKGGLVRKLEIMGRVADYEYTTNALVPFGIPTKITVGRHWFWYSKIILIEELVYGHADDPQNTFSAESKYESPKLPTLYQFDGGKEKLVRQGYEPPMPKPKK